MSELDLSTDEARVSYGIGRQLGGQLRDNPPPGVSLDAVLAGLADAFAGQQSRVGEAELSASFKVIRDVMQAEAKAKAEAAAGAGLAFLAENAKRDGVTVLASGLQYEVLTAGEGAKPSRDDSVEVVDLSRYFEELGGELFGSLGEAWERQITQDYAPILVTTDRAVSLGLILNELTTNAIKYAYGSEPGPLGITLLEHRDRLRLTISDKGVGRSGTVKGSGFGTRMLAALVERLDGTLEYEDNHPGVRAILTAPIQGAAWVSQRTGQTRDR